MDPRNNRFDFVLLFDVRNGNPNGDPDAGNSPRIDPETGHGLVSDVALKRKLRNFIVLARSDAEGNPQPGFDIYVKERAVLNRQHGRAYEALGLDAKKPPEGAVDKARAWMCQTFFDIRMFGAVMTTGVNCGQVRGPVQLTFARSVEPIVSLEQSITRMAVTKEEDLAKERTMGRKEIVPYGLYRAHGFVSPHLARQTGFDGADMDLLLEALQKMFEVDHSAARGEMSTRRLVVFQHESALGNAAAHSLFDRVQVRRVQADRPARDFGDYAITVDTNDLPAGVSVAIFG